jgi:integrase
MTDLERVIRNSVRLSRLTKETYVRTAKRFVAFAGEDPAGWTPRAATDFIATLQVSAKSLGLYTAHLKYMSKRFHHETGQIDFAAYLESPRFSAERQLIRSLTEAEAYRVLNAYDGTAPLEMRNRALFGLALTTGMRRAALSGLDVEHVDRRQRSTRIVLKGGGVFDVPLRDESLHYLAPWLGKVGDAGPLFRPIRGSEILANRLSYDSYRSVCEDLRERTGIAWLHMHTFRHTFITRARERGWTVPEIAAVTGHVVDLKGNSTIDSVYTDLAALARRHPRMGEFLWPLF